jgi:hypothetical protein
MHLVELQQIRTYFLRECRMIRQEELAVSLYPDICFSTLGKTGGPSPGLVGSVNMSLSLIQVIKPASWINVLVVCREHRMGYVPAFICAMTWQIPELYRQVSVFCYYSNESVSFLTIKQTLSSTNGKEDPFDVTVNCRCYERRKEWWSHSG